MNIYAIKDKKELRNLAKEFNKTVFGKLVCRFASVPFLMGIFCAIGMVINFDDVSFATYFIASVISIVCASISLLIYVFFLKGYVDYKKLEK